MPSDLSGVAVLVAGAGLAGLCAARDLLAMGADVTVVDARDRVGGRVWTIREPFADRQHAEGGGDMIDESHDQLRRLADELGLKTTRILRHGFAYARPDAHGRVRIMLRSARRGWERLSEQLSDLADRYRLGERRWDTPIASDLARQSVAEWLEETGADEDLKATVTGLRGFFLADPEELSLLALVDQFAEEESPAPWHMYRIEGGNDRLAEALAKPLGDRLRLNTEVAAVSRRGQAVRVSVKSERQVMQLQADYVLFALPATLLRRIPMTPALPQQQHEAIARVKYGRATKTLVQFSSRFWRAGDRPRAFGSPLPFGAAWDGNEEQHGKPGILSLLAGGSASDATRDLVARDGIDGLSRSLDWLGSGTAKVVAWRQLAWDADPWSRGGYAFFDPSFDPSLRAWLARPAPPLFFAGEHTSIKWQGYMNGAVESGRRAAEEIAATHRLGQDIKS
jgi:monoamine oxidase